MELITSNHLDIAIRVVIDKVNRFVSVYAETGASIKVESGSTYATTKNNTSGTVIYFDYPSTLKNLLFKLTLLNTDEKTI